MRLKLMKKEIGQRQGQVTHHQEKKEQGVRY